jgi:hypothetical protein
LKYTNGSLDFWISYSIYRVFKVTKIFVIYIFWRRKDWIHNITKEHEDNDTNDLENKTNKEQMPKIKT